jgi:hypothetical protein
MEKTEYKGYNGTLIISDTGVEIKKNLLSGLFHGNKTISYHTIAAVQFKEAGMVAGYIQVEPFGSHQQKNTALGVSQDENTICFHVWGGKNKKFTEAKKIIEQKIAEARNAGTKKETGADELEKYAQLRDKGVITEDEFKQKKKQLLGI